MTIRAFQKDRVPNPTHHVYPEISQLDQPLTIEIGCGVGRHPMQWARQNPGQKIIAIEKSSMRYKKMLDTLEHLDLHASVVPVQSNAVSFITHHIPEQSVEKYFILYPNPYPKEGQSNKRWHNMPFMQHLIATMVDQGTIHLATNMEFYMDEALERMQNTWNLNCIARYTYNSEHQPKNYHTHFEEKYILRGQDCLHAVFQKT